MPMPDDLKKDIDNGTIIQEEPVKFAPVEPIIQQSEIVEAIEAQPELPEIIAEAKSEAPVEACCECKCDCEGVAAKLEELQQELAKLKASVACIPTQDLSAELGKIEVGMQALTEKVSVPVAEPKPNALLNKLQALLEKQEKNDKMLTQLARDYTNYQVQVRQGMQGELEKMKKQVEKEQFTPLLKDIGEVYVDHIDVLKDETLAPKTRSAIEDLFDALQDVFLQYNVEVVSTDVGAVRPFGAKVMRKIATWEQEKHNTVAKSTRVGIVRNKKNVLWPEYLEVYVYDPNMPKPVEEDPAAEPTEVSVTE